MTGQLITPNTVQLPAGVSIVGLLTPEGIAPLPLRDVFALVALHAYVTRESSRLTAELGTMAYRVADAMLAARRPAPATSTDPAASAPAG